MGALGDIGREGERKREIEGERDGEKDSFISITLKYLIQIGI